MTRYGDAEFVDAFGTPIIQEITPKFRIYSAFAPQTAAVA